MSIKFNAKEYFDFDKKRFYLNDEPVVFHCHHYTTLLTQLANDAEKFGGPQLMFSAAEETFYPILKKYYQENNINVLDERIDIAVQYYSYIGLGQMKVDFKESKVELLHSHLDEAWLKKWSTTDKPVNYITQGFISAMFSAITDIELGAFRVKEVQSIACGAETSKFTVYNNQGE